jgi:predicted acetyltransferase
MTLEIQRASVSDKYILRNLMELCLHDFSEYENSDVDEHGLFGYPYLDHYWTEPERHPFLIKVMGKLAGFVLVWEIDSETHSVAEFFVMRKYRRQGIGRQAAFLIFDMFPGPWNVCQEKANLPAQAFWREVIHEYTQGNYVEQFVDSDEWHGPCQRFQSRVAR